jgi:hypothetical protein
LVGEKWTPLRSCPLFPNLYDDYEDPSVIEHQVDPIGLSGFVDFHQDCVDESQAVGAVNPRLKRASDSRQKWATKKETPRPQLLHFSNQ